MSLKNINYNDVTNLDTPDLMNTEFKCICGNTHKIPIKILKMGTGIIDSTKEELDKIGTHGTAGLIYDKKIENIVMPVIEKLKSKFGNINTLYFGENNKDVHPEISNSKKAALFFKGKVDFLISVGSGVISDITKYTGEIMGIPVVLLPTAPSMNGYTSTMGAMKEEGIKKTLPVNSLTAIFADIEILRNSPVEMVLSGFGDILSKATSVADWKLSNLIKKTYFCPMTFYITDRAEKEYMSIPEEIGKKSENGILALTDGIMRSGLSMTIVGVSTPSSGSEHVLSHYWDLMALINNRKSNLHGTQVGVATPITGRLFDFISEYPVRKKININSIKNRYMEGDEIKNYLLKKYGKYYSGLWDQVSKKYTPWEKKKKEVEQVIDNWYEIWEEVYRFIRPPAKIEEALKKSGAPVKYRDIGLTRDDVIDSIINGWVLRSRYTVLDLLHDLDLSEKAAEKVVN